MLKESLVKAGIEHYAGVSVAELKLHEDSLGAIAIRARLEHPEFDDVWTDFLIAAFDVNKCKDAPTISDHLEEVEFTSWPPTEGKPRIF